MKGGIMKQWREIKDVYRKWPVDEHGYNISPEGFATKIGDRARVGEGARVGDRARVGDWAMVGDWARVGDRARVEKRLTYIIGSMHQVYLYDPEKQMIGIGCMVKTVAEWREQYVSVGEENNYSEDQIKEYAGYIELFAASLRRREL